MQYGSFSPTAASPAIPLVYDAVMYSWSGAIGTMSAIVYLSSDPDLNSIQDEPKHNGDPQLHDHS